MTKSGIELGFLERARFVVAAAGRGCDGVDAARTCDGTDEGRACDGVTASPRFECHTAFALVADLPTNMKGFGRASFAGRNVGHGTPGGHRPIFRQ